MITFPHTADIHLSPDRFEEARASLMKLADDYREHPPKFFVVSGDTWDGPVQNTGRARFTEMIEAVRQLADIAPVVMIYGTPTHDVSGSLEVFETQTSEYGITILRPGTTYFLNEKENGDIFVSSKSSAFACAILFGVPEPGKEWLNAGESKSGASEEARQEGLKRLFLGLAAQRQQYPNLPCILLYHGQVRGARMQNDQVVSDAVSIDDLRAVGATYIALGDIHEPQQVGDLPAYYPGSIYPIDFGETHQAGYNHVEIHERDLVAQTPRETDLFSEIDFRVDIRRRDFPHPLQKTLRVKFGHSFMNDDVAGYRVKVEITVARDQAHNVDTDVILRSLLAKGAVEGSKVVLNVLPVETVRAAEITESKTLAEKVQVWADASDITVPEGALKKAAELEAEGKSSGVTGSGLSIMIQKLVLRGSIGIFKGQKKDEIVLNFEDIDPGLVALVGKNGAGKTTLIENMHPWPSMLTRDGKLQDHFRLRDSFRDLYFMDTSTGIRYRALMNIDGKNKSGSVEYFLYQGTGSGWQPLEGINGRKDPYESWINKLFGSLGLFLQSAFSTQRPAKAAPDLAFAKPAERRSLFAELSGIDYLQRYAELAREKSKANSGTISRKEGELEATERRVADLPDLETRLTEGARYLDRVRSELESSDKSLAEARAKAETAAETSRKQEETLAKIRENQKKIAEIKQKRDSLQLQVSAYKQALHGKDQAEKDLGEWEAKDAELNGIAKRRAAFNEQYQKQLSEWSDKDQAFRDSMASITEEIKTLEKALSTLEADRKILTADIQRSEKELETPVDDSCPTCGQKWPEARLKAYRDERQRKSDDIRQKKKNLEENGIALKNTEAAIKEQREAGGALGNPPDKPVAGEFPEYQRQADLEMDLEFYDIDAIRETLSRAKEAEIRIEAAEPQIAEYTEQVDTLTNETGVLEQSYDPMHSTRLKDAQDRVHSLESSVMTLRDQKTVYSTRIEELRTQITRIKKLVEETAGIRTEIESLRTEQALWEFLTQACGQNGIQALELDAVAPNITEVANRLLAAAYGSRFQIEIRTTRMAGTGSRVKQVEDFEIWILDTEDMGEQTLDTLSGGEAVWIKKALYDAFGIIRSRNTGMSFLTVFLDEADGALDPAAREHYFRMLEAAHTESKRHHTVLITHSREIQEIISQRIDICELYAPNTSQGAAA